MNNYREMYEALLQGETLQSDMREEIVMRDDGVLVNQNGSLRWLEDMNPRQWSIKPKTVNINSFEVPEPIREPLKEGESFWLTNLDEESGYVLIPWVNIKEYNFWLSKGMIHRTEEAAVLHAKALWSFTAKEGV